MGSFTVLEKCLKCSNKNCQQTSLVIISSSKLCLHCVQDKYKKQFQKINIQGEIFFFHSLFSLRELPFCHMSKQFFDIFLFIYEVDQSIEISFRY